jgi:hypothetical protein
MSQGVGEKVSYVLYIMTLCHTVMLSRVADLGLESLSFHKSITRIALHNTNSHSRLFFIVITRHHQQYISYPHPQQQNYL